MSTVYCKYGYTWTVQESVEEIQKMLLESRQYVKLTIKMSIKDKSITILRENIVAFEEN